MGFFEKISDGLKKTRDIADGPSGGSGCRSFTKMDEDFFDELEETLIMGDVGAQCDHAHHATSCGTGSRDAGHHRALLRSSDSCEEIITGLLGEESPLDLSTKPSVMLVIGVNGVGKTTTIGKMAAYLQGEGKQVLLAAADTFRAAAIEQLAVWADRAGAELIQPRGGQPTRLRWCSMPSTPARARGADVIICDTAGRLHNKKNLMDELAKIARVIEPGTARLRQWRYCWCWMPPPVRTPSTRPSSFQEAAGHHRHCAHQAGRHRQGRRCHRHPGGAGRAGEVHRRRRRH